MLLRSWTGWIQRFLQMQPCRILSFSWEDILGSVEMWVPSGVRKYAKPGCLDEEKPIYLRPWHLPWNPQSGLKGMLEGVVCQHYFFNIYVVSVQLRILHWQWFLQCLLSLVLIWGSHPPVGSADLHERLPYRSCRKCGTPNSDQTMSTPGVCFKLQAWSGKCFGYSSWCWYVAAPCHSFLQRVVTELCLHLCPAACVWAPTFLRGEI